MARFREIDNWFRLPEGGLTLGPDYETGIALTEARFAYVNGFWLSAILMSLTALERHLAFRLENAGTPDTERLRAAELITLAVKVGFVTEPQAVEINELRKYRNAYAHYRRNSRYIWNTRSQRERQEEIWEASGEDNSIEGVNVNMVLHAEAKRAVILASAYFLVAGRDVLSD